MRLTVKLVLSLCILIAKGVLGENAPSSALNWTVTAGKVAYGTAYQDAGFVYNYGNYHSLLGSRGYKVIYDNVRHDFIFRETSSAFMGYLPHDTRRGLHWGHLEIKLQNKCIGPSILGIERTPLILMDCIDSDDSHQLAQFWQWNDRTNKLTFLGQKYGASNESVSIYELAPPDPVDDTLYLMDHTSRAHTFVTLGGLTPSSGQLE